jgi:hypothetical protein
MVEGVEWLRACGRKWMEEATLVRQGVPEDDEW